MTRKGVHSTLGLPQRHPWICNGFHVFARPLRRDLPGNIRSTCITVGFPAFSYAFPCALIYTEPLASLIFLLWDSQFLCLYLVLFVSFLSCFPGRFPYTFFVCIHPASHLFPLNFAIRCPVRYATLNLVRSPSVSLWGMSPVYSPWDPHAFSRPLHRAFHVGSLIYFPCINRGYPVRSLCESCDD